MLRKLRQVGENGEKNVPFGLFANFGERENFFLLFSMHFSSISYVTRHIQSGETWFCTVLSDWLKTANIVRAHNLM